jgi:hypothetical protein
MHVHESTLTIRPRPRLPPPVLWVQPTLPKLLWVLPLTKPPTLGYCPSTRSMICESTFLFHASSPPLFYPRQYLFGIEKEGINLIIHIIHSFHRFFKPDCGANSPSCIFAPPEPNSVIGNTEEIEVAWCVRMSFLVQSHDKS